MDPVTLTPSQRNAVNYDGHILVDACPGSGKTHALVAKLLRTLEDVRGSARRIACITYTNAAVSEVEDRLRRLGGQGDTELCHVSTIHAFCLQRILRPYSWLLGVFPHGFELVTRDDEKWQNAASAARQFAGGRMKVDVFENAGRDCSGAAVTEDPRDRGGVEKFWSLLLEQGAIDFSSLIYYAYVVVQRFPWVARGLASRYAWCLVDEIQDTTDVQVEILRAISNFGATKFFLVGDRNQAIFSFTGAKPFHVVSFASELAARNDIKFVDNFRSSLPVIAAAEDLIPQNMQCSGKLQQSWSEAVERHHVSNSFVAITEMFLPRVDELGIERGRCAVLAPWWTSLLFVGRELREFGVPITGPGARPYRRKHLFAGLAEHLCAAVTDGGTSSATLLRQLFFTLDQVNGHPPFGIYSYDGKRVMYQLLHMAERERRAVNGNGVAWLRRSAAAASNILVQHEWMNPEKSTAFSESVESIIDEMTVAKLNLSNLSVEDLGLFASTSRNLHLLNMHKAKGREYDAVALVDVHDGRIPDFRAVAGGDQEKIDEGRRVLYVAMTRARRLLMVFTDSNDPRNEPSRFLNDVRFEPRGGQKTRYKVV